MAGGTPTWLIAFVTIIGVRYVIDLALTRKAKRVHGKLAFDVTMPVRISFILGLPFFLGLAILAIIQHKPCWLDLIFLLFVTLALAAWPRLIVIDHESVSSHVWWWKKSVPWNQIKSIRYYTASLSTQVTGSNGIKIVHTGFHVDSARFRETLTKRSPVHEIEQVDRIFSR
jgi:hypothetical protein